MGHSRWDTLHHDSPFGQDILEIMMAQHQGYIMALEDALGDIDTHGPVESTFPHHVIRMLLGKLIDEAHGSLQALMKLADEQEKN